MELPKRMPTLESFNEDIDDRDILFDIKYPSQEYFKVFKRLEPYDPIDTENGILIKNYKEKIHTPDKLGYPFMTGNFEDLKPRKKPVKLKKGEKEVKAVEGFWQPMLDSYPRLSKKSKDIMQSILDKAKKDGKVTDREYQLLELMRRGELKPESFSSKN